MYWVETYDIVQKFSSCSLRFNVFEHNQFNPNPFSLLPVL